MMAARVGKTGGTVGRLVQLLVLVAIAGACKSSAPYTLPAAAIGTGVAAGFSAAQRSMGGCYATCTNGTACNPRTGFCEKAGAGCACLAGEVCLMDSSGAPKCVPPAMTIFSEREQAAGAFIVKPETGAIPQLPVPAPSSKP
jgi:hypothetical protein